MEKRSSTFSSETAIGIVLLCALIEIAIDRVPSLRAPNETVMLLEAHERRIEDVPGAQVLFLGDSTLRSSVDPALFETITGSSGVNLGLVSSGGFYTDLLLLERWLDRHQAPHDIVLIHGTAAFGTTLDPDLYRLVATPKSTMELALQRSLGGEASFDALLHWILPSYRYKVYLRQTFDGILAGGLDAFEQNRKTWTSFLEERQRDGYFPDPSPERLPAAGGDVVSFSMSELNRWALQRLLDRAEREGAKVHFSFGPLHAPAAVQRGRVRAHHEAVRALHDFGGLRVLRDVPVFSSDEEVGKQIDHLNRSGAARFTRELARAMNHDG